MGGESISAAMNSKFPEDFYKLKIISVNLHVKYTCSDLDEIFSSDLYDIDINDDEDSPKAM